MTYDVRVPRSVVKALNGLDRPTRRRLWARIRALAQNPRPPGARALRGSLKGYYRLRVGDYRVLYSLDDDRLLVSVARVGARRDVYDDAKRAR